MYTLYTGFEPFWGETHEDLILSNKIGYIDTTGPEWESLSIHGKEFILACLSVDPVKRLTPYQALNHPWITSAYGSDCMAYPPKTMKEIRKETRTSSCPVS